MSTETIDLANLDLESMELHELKKMKRDVDAAIDGFAKRQMRVALQEIEAVAKKHGLTLNDIANARNFTKTRKLRKATASYRNPKDPAKIWSGMGRKPAWFEEALASGLTKEDMLVKA